MKMRTDVKQIQWRYNLILFLFWFSTALPLALMVLLFQARGLSLWQISLGMAIYSATIVLLEVPTGGLADATGRKRVTLIAYLLMAATTAVYLFTFSFSTYVVGMVLYGLSRALSSGALDAWFVDALQAAEPDIDLQPCLAKAGTFSLLALGLGTLIGGLLPQLAPSLPVDGTAVITPLTIPLLASFAIRLLLLILLVLLVHEPKPAANSPSWRDGFKETPHILRHAFHLTRHNSTILLLLGATAAASLAVMAIEIFWQPRFADLLGGAAENSLIFGIIMAGSFLMGMGGNMASTPLSRWLKQRHGLVAALGQGAFGLCLLLLARQQGAPLAALFFWLAYMNMGLLNSPHNTLLNREIPATRRSAMLSIQSLAGYAGGMIGSVLLGFMAENHSIGAAWILASSVLMVSLGLYLMIDRQQQRQANRHEPDPALLEVR